MCQAWGEFSSNPRFSCSVHYGPRKLVHALSTTFLSVERQRQQINLGRIPSFKFCALIYFEKKCNFLLPPLFIVPADISSCDGRGIQEACGFGCGVKWYGCTKKTFPRTLEDGWVDKDLPWAERSLVSCLTFLSQVQVTYSSAIALKKLFWQVLTVSGFLHGWRSFLNLNSGGCNCGSGFIYAQEMKIQPIQEWSWLLSVLCCRLSETVLTGSHHDSVSP